MKTQIQQEIRTLVRCREDMQLARIRVDNRIGRKADGSEQNIDGRTLDKIGSMLQASWADNTRIVEEAIVKELKKKLKQLPIWTNWLDHVKGVGEVAAGWLVGEFDIEKATTVSKLWQYAGLNPGMVRGVKSVSKKEYKPKMGTIIGELPPLRDGSKRVRVLTDTMVRGDKMTKDFLSPFNKNLRTALCGVMADNFIKCQNSYAMEFYYPCKARLEQSTGKVLHFKKECVWKDVSKGHRDRAAKRFMVKKFLADLYEHWREAEGLPVRKPYAEEYLGRKHTGGKPKMARNKPSSKRNP